MSRIYSKVVSYARVIRFKHMEGIKWVYVDKNLNVRITDKLPDQYYMKGDILVVDDPKEYLININKKEPSKNELDEFIYHGKKDICENVNIDYKPYKKEIFKAYRGSIIEEKGKKINLWLYGLRFLVNSYKNLY